MARTPEPDEAVASPAASPASSSAPGEPGLIAQIGRILERWDGPQARARAHAHNQLGAQKSRASARRGIGLRRILLRAVSVLLVAGGLVMLTGPDFTPGRFPTLDSYLKPTVTQAQDFVLRNFAADYTLDRDAGGRSRISVVETVDAVIRNAGVTGIERYLPAEFGEQTVKTTITSVTTDAGEPVPYTLDRVGDFWHITTTAPAELTGEHIFLIRYVQTAVTTRSMGSESAAPRDVFKWSMTGDSWLQPMAGADITVRMSEALADALVSAPRYGYSWAILSGHADLERDSGGNGQVVFTGRVDSTLPRFASVWAQLEFRAGTFAAPQWSLLAWARLIAPFVPILLGFLLLFTSVIARQTVWRNAPGRGIVIAESQPQPGIDLLLAAHILGRGRRGIVADLLDLAVRGNLRLLRVGTLPASTTPAHTTPANTIPAGKNPAASISGTSMAPEAPHAPVWYEFDFVHLAGLSEGEKLLVMSIFGNGVITSKPRGLRPVRVGARSGTLRARLRAISFVTWRMCLSGDYRRVPAGFVRDLLTWGAIATTALQWGFSRQLAYHASDSQGWLLFWASAASTAVTLTTFALAVTWYPLTPKGALAREHLLGMREYIRVAEQQRIRYLHSPKGTHYDAIRSRGRTVEVAELHDSLVPYAVLFGQERDWQRSLDLASAGALPNGWWLPPDLVRH